MTPSRICAWTLIAWLCPLVPAADDFLPSQALYEAGLAKFWQLRIPLEKDQRVLDAYLVDDQLYLGTQDGYAYAIDAYTGVLRWVQPIARSGYRVRRPCHAEDRTVFVTPHDIQVYDRRTGDGISRRELRFPSATGPVCDGDRLFIGGLDGRLHVFDIDAERALWQVVVDGPIASTPTVLGDFVYVANDGQSVYACTRATKTFQWEIVTSGAITADLVADDNGVYVASQDQSLYLVNAEFGQIKWRVRFASPLREPPFVTPMTAYQYALGEGVVALETGPGFDVENKRVRWKLPQGRQVLATGQDVVYMLAGDGTLLEVAIKDGQVRHTVAASGFALGVPVPDNPTIFLAAADGRLFCARPPGIPFPRRQDVLNALRPLGAGQGEGAATQPTSQPTTRPVTKTPNPLQAGSRGVPLGGKSDVTKGFKGKEGPE